MSLEINNGYLQVTPPIHYWYPIAEFPGVSGRGVVLGTLFQLLKACAWCCHRQVSFPWPNWGTSHRHILAGQTKTSSDFKDNGTLDGRPSSLEWLFSENALTFHSCSLVHKEVILHGIWCQTVRFRNKTFTHFRMPQAKRIPRAEELRFWRCHDTCGTERDTRQWTVEPVPETRHWFPGVLINMCSSHTVAMKHSKARIQSLIWRCTLQAQSACSQDLRYTKTCWCVNTKHKKYLKHFKTMK